MIRTFLAFAVALAALMLASALVADCLVDPAVVSDSGRSFHAILRAPVSSAADAIARAEDREGILHDWEATLGMPLAVALGEGPPPGEIEIVLGAEGEAYARASVGADSVLRAGPIPNPPWDLVNDALMASLLVDLGLVVVVSCVLTLPLLVRLRRLRVAADAIAAGDTSARTGLSGRGELGRLGARFDAMARSVQHSVQAQRDLMQAVSHEFRTPIARLRFLVEEMVQAQQLHERTTVREEMERDLGELEGLVDEILTYARLEARRPDPQRSASISAVVHTVASSLANIGVPARVEPGPEINAKISRPDLSRALRNLLTNAQRHAAGRVVVGWEARGAYALVTVDDDGKGVPAAAREAVFEPFYRGPRGERGLGLAIVRRIAGCNGGEVSVGEAEIGGARFCLRLPGIDPEGVVHGQGRISADTSSTAASPYSSSVP